MNDNTNSILNGQTDYEIINKVFPKKYMFTFNMLPCSLFDQNESLTSQYIQRD